MFIPKINNTITDFITWFLKNLDVNETSPGLNLDHSTVFVFCIWRIWLRRNLWLFQKENKPIGFWCSQTINLAREFINHDHPHLLNVKPLHILPLSTHARFIVKVDATFCNTSLLASYAIICRDENHLFIDGVAGTTTSVASNAVETQTIMLAISWATVRKWKEVTIISNCKNAVDNINDEHTSTTWFSNLHGKCRDMLKIQGNPYLKSRRREEMKEADYVAKKAKTQLSLLHRGVSFTPTQQKQLHFI